MRKVTFFLMLFYGITQAQTTVLPSKLVNEFLQNKSAFSEDIIIEITSTTDNVYEFKLTLKETTDSFKLKPLSFEEFEKKINASIEEILDEENISIDPNKDLNSVRPSIALIYGQLITELRIDNVKPKIATIYLKDNIPVFWNNTTEENIGLLENVKADLTFYDGFIEKIKVSGTIEDKEVVFRNIYSIGISSIENIKGFSTTNLFSMYKYDYITENDTINIAYKIKLNNVINYDEVVNVNTNDLSPATSEIHLSKNNKSVELFKDETTKLLEARIYSDLLGMFDEENPNGIIQTEVKKRFNINTKRHQVTPWLDWLFKGFGTAQYFEAFFEFSKIEKNNKFLTPENRVLDLTDSDSLKPFFTPISLYQFRTFAIGGNLNIFTFENSNTKMLFNLDVGYLFGRSGIKDYGNEITKTEFEDEQNQNYEEKFLNNMEIPIEAKLVLLPEKRLNFTFSNKLSWFETFDDNININSIEKDLYVSKNRWLNTINAGINLNLSNEGRLFVRYKITHELDNLNTNFSRLQFGYSFFLLKSQKSTSPVEKFSN